MVLPHKNKVGGRNLLFLFRSGTIKKNKLDFLGVFENFCVVKPQTICVKTLIPKSFSKISPWARPKHEDQ